MVTATMAKDKFQEAQKILVDAGIACGQFIFEGNQVTFYFRKAKKYQKDFIVAIQFILPFAQVK